MLPFRLFIQDLPANTVAPFVVSKATLISELQAGDFERIAVFEMVSAKFESSMTDYVAELRQRTDQPVSVVVLVESRSTR